MENLHLHMLTNTELKVLQQQLFKILIKKHQWHKCLKFRKTNKLKLQ